MCDVIDTNWVDVNFIISIVIMNYEKEKDIYSLNCLDANSLNEFVIDKFCNCNFFISITFHAFIFALTSKIF